ncbi:hypothetical protein OJF2_05810 [Aquisphaera giovannonii]|uniref:Uncharacterized protein n=1 Tax=Aquisphaera giovannonii TaxID=406548 RepID=A0A5B9VV55_9BACT|nr:hypothetical protein [Aquisphaera giovannonii]QEH32112.1 hypothetical protein OJF2_05810 [Aquisphaera giovannonii]
MTTIRDRDRVTFRFETDGLFTRVAPPLPGWVLRGLEFRRRVYRAGGPRGVESSVETHRAWSRDEDGATRIFSGHVPRVRRLLLEEDGHDVVVEDSAERDRHPRDRASRRGVAPATRELLLGLALEPRGQLRATRPGDVSRLIRAVARSFGGKVMVACTTRREVYRLADDLRRSMGEPVLGITKGLATSDVRIQVGTLGSLDTDGAAVVVLAGTRQALHSKMIEELAWIDRPRLHRPRIYGIRVPSDRLSPREELEAEGLLGPFLGEAAVRPAARAPEVLLAGWRGGGLPGIGPGLQWKRRAIWGNEDRNAAVAAIAAALLGGDASLLREHGLSLDDGANRARRRGRRRVAVLVESPEHARRLAALLPGWAVLSGIPGTGPGSHDRGGRDAGPSPWRGLIVTLVRASDAGLPRVDVVVRADGAAGAPAGGHTRRGILGGGPTIVDLDDRFDAAARDATRSRLHSYAVLGWRVRDGRGASPGAADE